MKSGGYASAQASRPAFTRFDEWRIAFSRIQVPQQPTKPWHRRQRSEHRLEPLEATPKHRLVAVDDRFAQRALDLVDSLDLGGVGATQKDAVGVASIVSARKLRPFIRSDAGEFEPL